MRRRLKWQPSCADSRVIQAGEPGSLKGDRLRKDRAWASRKCATTRTSVSANAPACNGGVRGAMGGAPRGRGNTGPT